MSPSCRFWWIVTIASTTTHLSSMTRTGGVVGVAAMIVVGDETRSETIPNDSLDQHHNNDDSTCSLMMAPSTIPNSGWGIFSLRRRVKGETVNPQEGGAGDLVIHLTDPNPQTAGGMKRMIWDYLWDGHEVGGQYEGQRVMSVVPGIGMLANGHKTMWNVRPLKPFVDDAGVTRRNPSPVRGSFTHYHNLTWIADRDIHEGSEIFVNYGGGWFEERGYDSQKQPSGRRSTEWLRQHGYCLDNLVPGLSTIPNAGRGSFASRPLREGMIVAPVPVLPLTVDSLKTLKEHESGRIIVSDQLLRNYCLGQANSSILLYPYSPMINLINHASGHKANVQLRWSKLTATSLHDIPLSKVIDSSSSPPLLMELVAIRPIAKGDEIVLDYGRDWQKAWDEHVHRWQPVDSMSSPSSQMANSDPSNQVVRTAAEQLRNPYPENLFTSCYYDYNSNDERGSPTYAEFHVWTLTEELMTTSRHLRPCIVLDRHHRTAVKPNEDNVDQDTVLYTVQILNRPGLPPSARIPKGRPHIITSVPRDAIQFSDKLYTTDQHLEHSFRHEIGLPGRNFLTTG